MFRSGVRDLREPRGDRDPFALEEAERLVKTTSAQDRTLVTPLNFRSLRPKEALAFHWKMSIIKYVRV